MEIRSIRLTVGFIVLLLAHSVSAQSWLCTSPIMTDKVVVRTFSKSTLPYAHCNDTACTANADTLLMAVYIPTSMKNNIAMPTKFPFIMMFTGGGFLQGDHVMKQWPEAFVKRGFIVATIDYRLGWDVDGDGLIEPDDAEGDTVQADCVGDANTYLRAVIRAVVDADKAMRFLLADTVAYPINTAALFTGGPSAGGSLAVHMGFADPAEHAAYWQAATDSLPLINDPCDMRFDPIPCSAITDTTDTIGFYQGPYKFKGIFNGWGQLAGPTLIDPGLDSTDNADEVGLISFYGANDHVHPPYIGPGYYCEDMPDGYGSQRLHELRLQHGYCSQLYEDPDAKHKEVFMDGIDTLSGSEGTTLRRFRAQFIAQRASCFFKSVLCGTPCSYDSTLVMDGIADWAQAWYNEYGTVNGQPVGCNNDGSMRFTPIPPPDSLAAGPPRSMEFAEEYTGTAELLILPNPSNGVVHFIWDSDTEEARYVVMDALGRKVLQGAAMNNGYGINSSVLDSGLYTVMLEDLGVLYTARLIVRH